MDSSNIDSTSQNATESYTAFIRQQQNQRQANRRNQIQSPRVDRRKRINNSTLHPNFQASTSNQARTNIVHSKVRGISNLLNIPTNAYVLPTWNYCEHCGARKFYRETKGFCCSDGKVKLYMPDSPTELYNLFTSKEPECMEFKIISRGYNTHFVFTSFGVKCDTELFRAYKASQVAAVWIEDDDNANIRVRDITIYGHSDDSHKVHYYYGCYDPLQYPLIFPFGEPGWHEGIQRYKKTYFETQNLPECVAFPSTVNFATEIIANEAQDMYVKIETARLDYFRSNQKQIRAELYQGIVDSVQNGGTRGSKIGKKIVLPQTFTCGPRDMLKRYLDAMAIVQRYGKPDIFLTITCNPNLPEIMQELKHNDEVRNRPDLIARIFRAKLEGLKNDLYKENIFGSVVAHIYMIEFQKRGLPHAHLLLIFNSANKICCAEQVDMIVSCEIPDKNKYLHLHSVIAKHNMHGPCGTLNPKNICMLASSGCKNKYPKDYCNSTIFGDNSYPLYRRRDNGISIKVRGQMLDNRWVVPYNPYLSAKFDCHINVEVCSFIKAVKYLYKYVYKGHDQIYPTVCALQLHIKDHQHVTYNSKDDLSVIIGNEKQHIVIGRIVTVNPSEGERYFLRVLLNHIKGPTSYDSFKTLNEVTVNTYREAALLHGLLKGDNHCEECLSEAIIYKMPSSLRHLFATLLTLCNPNYPKLLWDKYKAYMIDDYVHRNICVRDAEIQALEDINSILESSGKNVNDYGIVSFFVNIDETQRLARMIAEETMNFNIQRDFNCVEKFNKEQRFAYDKVMEKVKNDSSGTFFIDGPGGTGKTFLYKALLTAVRGQHLIALATSSSEVAGLCYLEVAQLIQDLKFL
ncbi:uncharacterized protein LOC111377922 [Olea europaea var. sylvestris]|uniref:uncharacterized protein LOC111377922 n=1 Tax=Olea europaea var. sylvestris TaxID=158386 RepID=UPI000C1D6E90|nr:uncharacterized protein LOC111377922 [Olea europaea var. sylvestris]